MEDTGRLAPLGNASNAAVTRGEGGRLRSGEPVDTGIRSGQAQAPVSALQPGRPRNLGQHQARTRVHRRIEHIRPAAYTDAEQVAQELKRGAVVVLDLRTTRPELAKRILDFSFGVTSALEGQVDRHVDRVYVFTRNGPLGDEERAAIRI
jgi:cell division inhibitor SepF